MFSSAEINLFNTWPIGEAKEWIQKNKPSEKTSKNASREFLAITTIEGSKLFVEKMRNLVEKTASLATGVIIFQRLIALNRNIKIIAAKEGQSSGYQVDKGITLSFLNKSCHVKTLNHSGEPIIQKLSSKSCLIHELIHVYHCYDQTAAQSLMKATQTIESMDNVYEERAITGHLNLKKRDNVQYDYCCENTALTELKRFIRLNHNGIELPKGVPPTIEYLMKNNATDVLQEIVDGLFPSYNTNELKVEAAVALESLQKLQFFAERGTHLSGALYELVVCKTSPAALQVKDFLLRKRIVPSPRSLFLALADRQPASQIHQLLEAGATPSLCMLEIEHSVETLKLLFNKGLAPTGMMMEKAIMENDFEKVQLFHAHGIRPSEKSLQHLFLSNKQQIVTLLTRKGMEPQILTAIKKAPVELQTQMVSIAILHKAHDMLALLIKAEAKPSVKDLENGLWFGDERLIKQLLSMNIQLSDSTKSKLLAYARPEVLLLVQSMKK